MDINLLQKNIAIDRSEQSYRKLFLHFYARILRFANVYVRQREVAEEIVSDVMIKLWTMEGRLLEITNLNVYINTFLAGNYVVPNTDGNWAWTTERQLNYFLQRYHKAQVAAEIKNRYAAEIRLFRAYTYWRKVVRYGDVPWLGTDLTEVSPELYAPRDPHKTVMDSVLADLDFAITHLPLPANAEQDRLNRDVAQALKARICLWEGT